MKRIKIILGLVLFASVTTFAQSPRIKLNQITKDTVKGSVLISSSSDSGMVYSRDFYIAYGTDTVLILYGDTLAATSGIISSVLSDGVTITGDGTSGNELKVDTATVISTIQGLVDTLTARGYLTANETITLSGDVTGSGTTSITATVVDDSHDHIISNVDNLQDSLDAKANDSDLTNYVTLSGTDSITGAKTFTAALTQSGGNVNFDLGTNKFILGDVNDNLTFGQDGGGSYLERIGSTQPKSATRFQTRYNNNYVGFRISDSDGFQYYDGLNAFPTDNKFVIEKSTGNVGIGTNTPSNKLTIGLSSSSNNDTIPVLRLQGYGVLYNSVSYGSYGGMLFNANNSYTSAARRYLLTNALGFNKFAIIRSVDANTDPTLGANGAISSGTADFVLDNTGNVGIGTSPSEKLDVNGNARFRSIGSGASSGALHYTSTGVLTTNTSDARLKTNLQPLENTLNKLLGINTYTFNWINETDRVDLGMIAQEVEQIFPNLVFTNSVDGYKGIHYDKFSSILTKAIQEQQEQIETIQTELDAKSLIIETQEQKITDLQTTIQALITRIENLENK